MKTLMMMILVSVSMVFAADIQWAKSYKDALSQAESSKKPILLLVEKEDCPYCDMLKAEVLSKDLVSGFINENYVPVKVMQNDGTYSAQYFSIFGTPTTFFVTPEGDKYNKPVIGFVEKDEYMASLKKGLE